MRSIQIIKSNKVPINVFLKELLLFFFSISMMMGQLIDQSLLHHIKQRRYSFTSQVWLISQNLFFWFKKRCSICYITTVQIMNPLIFLFWSIINCSQFVDFSINSKCRLNSNLFSRIINQFESLTCFCHNGIFLTATKKSKLTKEIRWTNVKCSMFTLYLFHHRPEDTFKSRGMRI